MKVVGFCEPLGLGGDTQTPRLTQGRFCRDQPPRGAAGTSPPRPGWVLLTRARLYKGWRNREGSMFKEGPWTHSGQSPASPGPRALPPVLTPFTLSQAGTQGKRHARGPRRSPYKVKTEA